MVTSSGLGDHQGRPSVPAIHHLTAIDIWRDTSHAVIMITVVSTLVGSYVYDSERLAGAAAQLAATRKSYKYANLTPSFLFQLIALENLGAMNDCCYDFFRELGHRIALISGDVFESFSASFYSIQRFYSVLTYESFSPELPWINSYSDCF